MSRSPWNRNIHYHRILLHAVPPNCRRALDVGCGQGQLTRQLAPHCEEVIGIDADRDTLTRARANSSAARITFMEGDVMKHPFPDESFDFITAVATLHHLPLRPALTRFRDLLRPGGVLAVVGLYRNHSLEDYLWAAAAVPTSWMLRCLYGQAEVGAPVLDPKETLREIRAECDALIPGARFQRHLLFRYSFVWRKP
jgi:SAM-dependent methyltransferase